MQIQAQDEVAALEKTLSVEMMTMNPMKKVTQASTDPQPSSESAPSSPPSSPPSPCRLYLTIAAYNTLLLLCLFGPSFALFVTADIFLTTEMARGGASQSEWDSRWWSLPPLHFLFYIALLLSCLTLTLRCGNQKNRSKSSTPSTPSTPSALMLLCNNKKGNQKNEQKIIRVILIVVFLIVGAITLFVPNFLQREMKQEDQTVSRGNCTNSLDVQAQGYSLCPFLSSNPHFFQLSPSISFFQSKESSTSATVEREVNIKTTMLLLQKLDEYVSVLNLFPLDAKYKHLKTMLDEECVNELFDAICLMFAVPCQYSDCTVDRFDDSCHLRWVQSMIQCGKKQCQSTQGCDAEPQFSYQNVHEFFKQVESSLHGHLEDLPGVLRPQEEVMVKWVFKKLAKLANQAANTTMHNKMSSSSMCAMKWWQDSETLENEVNANETTCNPNIKTYRASEQRIYYDGSVGLVCMTTFVLIVLGCNGRMPVIKKPGVVRIVSILLGLILTCLVFVGGVNVERASFGENVEEDLWFWASLYYFVSFVCFHHSIEIWFQDASVVPSTTESKENTSRNNLKRSSSRILTTTVSCKNTIMKDVISSRGKYYFLRFYAKEIFEVAFQLAGVINSQTETDAFPAFFTTFFVGLNLLLVPVAINTAMAYSGPTMATGLAVLMESLFDKGFIVLSVLVRSTETTIGGRTVGEKILRHGITLVPAISFALNKSSYITLANQYKTHTLNERKKRAKQKWAAVREILDKERISALQRWSGNQKDIEKNPENQGSQQRAPSSRRSSRRRQSFVAMKENNKVTFYFNKIIGAISIFLGVVLTSIVSYRYAYITNHCREKLGPIFDCATPKYYFRAGLLFGELTCAEDQYKSLNCTNDELKGIQHIQENPNMYRNMTNLTSIDIAYNDLVSVPHSFVHLPRLKFLNVSGNEHMTKLPYALCASSSLEIVIVLKGTPVAKELDWNGEILKHAQTLNNTSPILQFSMHLGCLRALENTLTKISLANNQLNCPSDDDCRFSQVESLRKLTYLNLRNNTVSLFGMPMVEKTKHIMAGNVSGGMSLENNPVTKILLSAMTETLVNRCMRVSNSISDPSKILMVEIKLCTIAESTIINYDLKRFSSMTKLNLIGNKINSSMVFKSFPTSLTYLDLSGNHFVKLEGTPFLGLGFSSLDYVAFTLMTGPTRLGIVEPGFFSGLSTVTNLQLLWLDMNELKADTFRGLDKVSFIALKHSIIGTVQKNAFAGLSELIDLSLHSLRVGEYKIGCFGGSHIQDLTVEIPLKDGNIDPKLFDSMPSLKRLIISRTLLNADLTEAQPNINMTNVLDIARKYPDVEVSVWTCTTTKALLRDCIVRHVTVVAPK